jgi:hypothetical protein
MKSRARGGGRLLVLAVGLALLERPAEAGIHGLGPLLAKEAPTSAQERTLQDFQGKKLAIDASMAMYQFLIAVRVAGRDGVAHTLTSDAGDDTSHLQVCRKIGLLSRATLAWLSRKRLRPPLAAQAPTGRRQRPTFDTHV